MNTNTYEEEIRRMYSDAGLDFDADLLYYSSHGYVFRDLDFFLMGCCVEGRGWHIQAAAGNIFCCLLCMPYYLEWIGFARGPGSKYHWYRTDRLIRLL
jgi:hypothetical protein